MGATVTEERHPAAHLFLLPSLVVRLERLFAHFLLRQGLIHRPELRIGIIERDVESGRSAWRVSEIVCPAFHACTGSTWQDREYRCTCSGIPASATHDAGATGNAGGSSCGNS